MQRGLQQEGGTMSRVPFNPRFNHALAIAKMIQNSANNTIRKAAILAWCAALKKAIG